MDYWIKSIMAIRDLLGTMRKEMAEELGEDFAVSYKWEAGHVQFIFDFNGARITTSQYKVTDLPTTDSILSEVFRDYL